jgi:hypothetical protein
VSKAPIGGKLIPIEFEISCELPDKYIRRDEFPAQDAGPATAGFNGNLLIRIRRAIGADTVEETTFDRFRVNPKIDPKKFEAK